MKSILVQLGEECHSDSLRWFPNSPSDIQHYTLGMVGEVGEFVNVLKKVQRGSITLDEALDDLSLELTDVFIYMLNIANLLGIDLEEVYEVKRKFNEKRFGHAAAKSGPGVSTG